MLELGACIEDIFRCIDEKIIARKEMLFMPMPYYYKKYDGTLYNMQYGMGAIKKIKDVLNTFKEVKENIALIWTIKLFINVDANILLDSDFVQGFTKEYLKILKDFETEGLGVIARLEDLDMACRLCDGYYGDSCRIVNMVGRYGKVRMIMKFEI